MPTLDMLGMVLRYSGPERRQSEGSAMWNLLTALLDEIDYGILLVSQVDKVIHANQAACVRLAEGQPIEIKGGRLMARNSELQATLSNALIGAQHRGNRMLLSVPLGDAPTTLGIVPLPPLGSDPAPDRGLTLVTLQRQQLVETLSANAFAKSHGLSQREMEVLSALCSGMKPAAIAAQMGIGVATVRTHIHNLKVKAQCDSMVELVQRVAVLPPVMDKPRVQLELL